MTQPGFVTDVYRAALDAAPCAILVTDAAGLITLVNPEAERLFGYRPGTLRGRPIEALVPVDLQAAHAAHRDRFVVRPDARPMGRQRDLRARRDDGSLFPVEVGLSPIHTEQGLQVVCAVVDLSERKRAEEHMVHQTAMLEAANARLAELAMTDSLTALWNRRTFLEQMDIQLEWAVRHAQPMSLLILDVDEFKPYNDEYGHLAGDEVLRGAARLLRDRARRSDFLARIGGEEFGVILHGADRIGAVKLAEHLRAAVEATQWPRRRITVSVGAATVHFAQPVPRPHSPERSHVLSLADRALYYSKQQGRNRVTHIEDLTTGASQDPSTSPPPGTHEAQ
jgi:diguanylate cyclase (GGDEF)-like protein/PAS domain S-box-containing protein